MQNTSMVSLAGCLQAKSMTSYRAEPSKMAGMRHHGNVMTTTRWRLYVILHLQQYSHRLNFFFLSSLCVAFFGFNVTCNQGCLNNLAMNIVFLPLSANVTYFCFISNLFRGFCLHVDRQKVLGVWIIMFILFRSYLQINISFR